MALDTTPPFEPASRDTFFLPGTFAASTFTRFIRWLVQRRSDDAMPRIGCVTGIGTAGLLMHGTVLQKYAPAIQLHGAARWGSAAVGVAILCVMYLGWYEAITEREERARRAEAWADSAAGRAWNAAPAPDADDDPGDVSARRPSGSVAPPGD